MESGHHHQGNKEAHTYTQSTHTHKNITSHMTVFWFLRPHQLVRGVSLDICPVERAKMMVFAFCMVSRLADTIGHACGRYTITCV